MVRIALRWLGTAGFQLRIGGTNGTTLLIDPLVSRGERARPTVDLAVDDIADADLILVSHGHFDHCMDLDTIAARSRAVIHAPAATCGVLARDGVARERLIAHRSALRFTQGRMRVTVVPSRHLVFDLPMILHTLWRVLRGGIFFELFERIKAYPEGESFELILDIDSYRLLYTGSGGGDWHRLAQYRPDCLLLPFAGRYDLADVYLRAVGIVRPRTVVLHHFDDFYPPFGIVVPQTQFRKGMAARYPTIELIVPEPMEWFMVGEVKGEV